MVIPAYPFQTTDWLGITPEPHKGVTGLAYWRTLLLGDIRIRMVEYTAGYEADHWCKKGHIIYCISGEMVTELEDGRRFVLSAGMSYQVGDNNEAHRSTSAQGCTLFIVD